MTQFQLILFDRDGTLTYENWPYHQSLSGLPAYPFAGSTLRALQAAGVQLAVVTNQSGIGRGYWSMEAVDTLHTRLCREWDVKPAFYICPHRPDEDCSCRKPELGLLEQALADHHAQPEQSLMVGDSLADYQAARNLNMAFALVLTGRGRVTLEQLTQSPAMVLDTVADLYEHFR